MDYFPASAVGHNYKIDKSYYLNEVNKIIESIEKGTRILDNPRGGQTGLF